MKNKNYKKVWIAQGSSDAQLKINYLKSYGIEAIAFEESVGKLYGLTNTPLGEVEIYVINADAERAKKLLSELTLHNKG